MGQLKVAGLVLDGTKLGRKQRKRRQKQPSKPERLFIEINEKYNLGFTYTGLSPRVIGSYYIPDFVNFERKIIVEIMGDYWHLQPKVFARDRRKFYMYRFMGFRVVFLWASELKDEERVIKWFI